MSKVGGKNMKKIFVIVILTIISINLNGVLSSAPQPVSDGINMAAEIGTVFSFTLGTREINFGKYIPGEQQPASQTVEITCDINAVSDDEQWRLIIYGQEFIGVHGQHLIDTPAFWVRKPTQQGEYQIPQGEINPLYTGDIDPVSGIAQIGTMPMYNWFYRSAPGERGRGILFLLNFSPNLPDDAMPDIYTTTVVITLELDIEF